VLEVPGAVARVTSAKPTMRPSSVSGLGSTPFIGDRVAKAISQAVLATIIREMTVAMRESAGDACAKVSECGAGRFGAGAP